MRLENPDWGAETLEYVAKAVREPRGSSITGPKEIEMYLRASDFVDASYLPLEGFVIEIYRVRKPKNG